jgi:acyl dehydratase
MKSDTQLLSVGDRYSYEFSFSEKDLRAFIDLSGDNNVIHRDESAAHRSPIGVIAVPGLLSALIFSRVLGTMFPGHGTVYRSQSLEFVRPVVLNRIYVALFEVTEIVRDRHRAWISTVISEKESRTACLLGKALVINLDRL